MGLQALLLTLTCCVLSLECSIAVHVQNLQRFLCSPTLSCALVLQIMILVPSGCNVGLVPSAYIVILTSRPLAALLTFLF